MHTCELCELCSHKTLKAPQPSVSDEKTDFFLQSHLYLVLCWTETEQTVQNINHLKN